MADEKLQGRTRPLSLRAMLAIAGACVITDGAGAAESPYMTVQEHTVSIQIEAYAQVRPIALLRVKAPAAGIVSGFSSLPGASIRSGDAVAKLTGPEVEMAITRAQAAIMTAIAKRAATEKTLNVLRSELASHLSTAQQVAQAEANQADANGALATAKAELESATLTATIRSPVAGTVVALNAAAGERVTVGDPLLTIQPLDQLWVTTVVYGSDAAAIRLGQSATFKPDADGTPIAVEVVSIAPTSGSTGDITVGLRGAQPNPGWRSGEYGALVFEGAGSRMVAVPTEALILDQGKWWVLVHSDQGDKPVEVVPGLSRGWETFVRGGLPAGTQIVTQNAYLEFHREIASRYQPPD